MKERQGNKTGGINQTKPFSLPALCSVIVFDMASQLGKGQLKRVFRSNGL